jgi:uncharacterized membrane protein
MGAEFEKQFGKHFGRVLAAFFGAILMYGLTNNLSLAVLVFFALIAAIYNRKLRDLVSTS